MALARRVGVEGIDSAKVATMRDDPGEPSGHPVTRRHVLLGGLGVVAATAVGALAAVTGDRGTGSAQAPAELVAARDAELRLIAAIDASVARDPALRAHLAPIRADHVAHRDALDGALASYPARSPAAAATRAGALDRPGLRAAERTAAAHAAQRAATLAGPNAALLASIAACEASHAELLA